VASRSSQGSGPTAAAPASAADVCRNVRRFTASKPPSSASAGGRPAAAATSTSTGSSSAAASQRRLSGRGIVPRSHLWTVCRVTPQAAPPSRAAAARTRVATSFSDRLRRTRASTMRAARHDCLVIVSCMVIGIAWEDVEQVCARGTVKRRSTVMSVRSGTAPCT
jgi:hypothetical protein